MNTDDFCNPAFIRRECIKIFKEGKRYQSLIDKINVAFAGDEEMIDFVLQERPDWDGPGDKVYYSWLIEQDDEDIEEWATVAIGRAKPN